MDPITHITAGALGGQTIRERFKGRAILWFCVLSAWIPDIDNLIGLGDPEFYLLHHRGITHSFLGGLFIAVLLAGIFKIFIRSFPFVAGILLSYACIGIHIFLDLITSYGTQIFAPFSNSRHTIHCIFILDPLITVPLIVLLFLSIRLKQKKTADCGGRFALGFSLSHGKPRYQRDPADISRKDFDTTKAPI